MNVSVFGAGSWGTAIAGVLCQNGHRVTLWSSSAEKCRALQRTRRHPNLPDVQLPEALLLTADVQEAALAGDIWVLAVASAYIRRTAGLLRPYAAAETGIISAAKGIETGSFLTMSEVISEVMAPAAVRIAAISGPTHAEEVSRGMPTAIVCACSEPGFRQEVCRLFSNAALRTYPGEDIRGAELSGALKNIVALAAGIAVGLGYGDNALAAIITRGMAEIKRLGLICGCRPETFDSLAGIGDLIVTCFSSHSRNRQAGMLIGQGVEPGEAIRRVGMVVEGIYALEAARSLAASRQVYMPLTEAVYDIVFGGAEPSETAVRLMRKDRETI